MWPNPEVPADLVTFTEEILCGKLHFLCSDYLISFCPKTIEKPKQSFLIISAGKWNNQFSQLHLIWKQNLGTNIFGPRNEVHCNKITNWRRTIMNLSRQYINNEITPMHVEAPVGWKLGHCSVSLLAKDLVYFCNWTKWKRNSLSILMTQFIVQKLIVKC